MVEVIIVDDAAVERPTVEKVADGRGIAIAYD
jgi:hypothetical protein